MDRRILWYITCVLSLLPLLAVACPDGEKYCAELDGCISESQNCSADGDILSCANMSALCDYNGTKHCVDVWNYTCGNFSCENDTHYCPTDEKCIDMDEYCCSEKEEACVEVLEYGHFFSRSKAVDSICDLLASEDGNFTANYTELIKYNNVLEKEMCDNGTYFCPLVLECISLNDTCDPDQVHAIDDDFEVFEEECAEHNETFCPLYMHCIPPGEDCSYRKLFEWYKAGNMSVDLYSQHCPENETFCALTFSCRNSCDPEDVMGNKSCNGTDEDMRCPESRDCDGNETDCKKRLGPANFTNVTDSTGSGWLETCKYRKLIKSVHWIRSSECKPLAKKCKKEKCEFKCENLWHMNKTRAEWMWDEIKSEGNVSLRVKDCHFNVDEHMMRKCNISSNMSCDSEKLCEILEEKMEHGNSYKNGSIWIEDCNMTMNVSSMMHECNMSMNMSCDSEKLCDILEEKMEHGNSYKNGSIWIEDCNMTMNVSSMMHKCNMSMNMSCDSEKLCEILEEKMEHGNSYKNGSIWIEDCNMTMNVSSMMHECNMSMNMSCDSEKLCEILEEKMEHGNSYKNGSIWIEDCNMTMNVSSMMHRCNLTKYRERCEVHELCDELEDELEQYEDGFLVNETIDIGHCNITLNETVYKICKKNRSCEIHELCKPLIENYYNESKINKTIRVEGCKIIFNETVIEACNITFGSCKIEDLCPKYRKLALNHTKKSFPLMVDGCKVDFEKMKQCNVSFLEKNDSCEVHKLCHLLGDALERYKNGSSESVWVGNCSIKIDYKVWDTCGNHSCEIMDLCKPLGKKLHKEKDDAWEMINSTIEIAMCNITLNHTVMEMCNISIKEDKPNCTIRKLCKTITENDYNISMVNKSIHVEECDIVLDKEVLEVCNISFGPSCKDLCPKFRELASNHTKYSFPKYIGKCKVHSLELHQLQEECNVTLRDLDDYYYEMFFNGFMISDSVKKTISHIAVRRVGLASDDGVWKYWHSGAWTPLGPVSSDRALILESSVRLRFMLNVSSWHGLATLMYSPVDSGATGSHIDVSDILHDPRHTLALLQYPSRPTANISRFIGPAYTVGEDEEDPGFQIEDKLELSISHTLMDKSVDGNMSEYFEHLPRNILKDYNETLKCFEDFIPAIAIIETGKSSEGRWIVNGRQVSSSVARPQVVAPYDWLSFLSAEHVHGNWSMKYVAVVFSNCSASVKEKYFDAPAPLAHALKGAVMLRNASKQARELVEDVLESMASSGTIYNLANFNGVVEGLVGSREDKDAALDMASKAFSAVTLPNRKHLSGLPRSLHPKGHLVILNNPTVFTFDVHVLPTNDQPGIKTPRIFLPDIAYNLTTHPNVGKLVKDLLTEAQASDIDKDKLGIAIVQALNSSIGSWYYKVASGVWTRVVVDNEEYTDSLSGIVSAYLLNSSCTLKFKMHDNGDLWNNLEASKYAKIIFLLSDGSDGHAIGWRNITRPSEDTSAYSEKSVTAIVRRIGCDGRAGSKGKEDVCGVCGGDGLSCMGCDGELNSGAIFDDCGNCTGGTTNVTYNVMKDCAKECGLSFTDKCGTCQRKDRFVNFTDCYGTCYGEAKINKCGLCAGGTSGRVVTSGEDRCGICSGDDSTCLDCAGVPNGGKVTDFCEKCLLPTDSRFNSECVKLKRSVPDSGPSVGGIKVVVQGAGLNTYSRVSCYFVKNGTNQRLSVPSSSFGQYENGRVIKFMSPALDPGNYYIHCQFDSEGVSHLVEDSMFLVYNKSAIYYNSISPEYIDINTAATAVIVGSGFVNTSDVACVSRDGRVFEAEFTSPERISCEIPATEASVRLELGVSFSRGDRSLEDHYINFTIYANASIPLSARFLNSLQGILITFNVPTKPREASKHCATFFPSSNVSLFGSRSFCIFRTSVKMVIVLRGRPSIAPNDTIRFRLASITQRFQRVTKDPVEMYEDLIVAPPKVSVIPTAVLTGSSFLGICAKLRLYGGQSRGAGGRRLTFIWGVEWDDRDDSRINSNATADLNETRQYLTSFLDFHPKVQFQSNSMIVIGPKYKFTLRVRNFLGEMSEEASLVVQREDKSLPGLSLGSNTRNMRTALGTTLQGRVKLSSCLPSGYKPKVLFAWEIQAVGINLGVVDQPILTIAKGLLQGGREYTLTLTAAMQSDLSLATTATIILRVESSPLKAIIKGGGTMVVGEEDTFTLDGSRSFDPDLSDDSASYNWKCFDEENNPCFEPDPDNAGRLRRMVIPAGMKASINVANALKTNSKYTFMLIFVKGNRKDESSVIVIVKSGSPPSVLIRPISAVKVNPTDVLILESFISSKKTVNATWSCVQDEEYGYIDLEAEGVALTSRYHTFKKGISKATLSASPSLVIAKNKLEDGVTYKFLLTVEHSDSSSFADIEITTNAAPSQGTLEVDPPSGFFSNTSFAFKAAEGWDDDADDLPMTYQFGYYIRESGELREELLGSPSETNSLDVDLLPQGEVANNYSLEVFVKVFDIYGAVTLQEATVVVKPIPIDAAAVNKLAGAVDSDFESGDLAKGAGKANAVAAALSSSGVSDVNTTLAAKKFKNGVTDKVLGAVEGGGVQDKSGRDVVKGSLLQMTSGCKPNCDAARVAGVLRSMTGASVSPSRRKRRAVPVSSIEIKTGEEVEGILGIFENVIDPDNYLNASLVSKTDFLSTVKAQEPSLCKGLAPGGPFELAKSNITVMRAVKDAFATVDTAFMEVSTSTAPEYIAASVMYKLGQSLKTQYESWACTGDDTCTGTCIASAQFKDDLLIQHDPAEKNITRLSDVASLRLYNPQTLEEITVSGLASPVALRFPIEHGEMYENYTKECRMWNEVSLEWQMSGCTGYKSLNESMVECSCTQLGYVAVFLGEEGLPTTPPPTQKPTKAPTTKAPTTKAPITGPQEEAVTVEFAFAANYSQVISGNTTKSVFISHLRPFLANLLNISQARITKIDIRSGSIIVTFTILPSNDTNVRSVNSTVDHLEKLVKSNNVNLTLPGSNQTLEVDPSSFKTIKPTPAPPLDDDDDDGLSTAEIVIIIVVCVVVVIAIIAGVLYYCLHVKPTRAGKISPHSSHMQLDERQNNNPGKNSGLENNAVDTDMYHEDKAEKAV